MINNQPLLKMYSTADSIGAASPALGLCVPFPIWSKPICALQFLWCWYPVLELAFLLFITCFLLWESLCRWYSFYHWGLLLFLGVHPHPRVLRLPGDEDTQRTDRMFTESICREDFWCHHFKLAGSCHDLRRSINQPKLLFKLPNASLVALCQRPEAKPLVWLFQFLFFVYNWSFSARNKFQALFWFPH